MINILIYIIVFFLTFILNEIASIIYKKKKMLSNILIMSSFLILLIFVGCRYYVGTDYESYLNIYNTVSSFDVSELNLIDIELGAKLLFKLIYILFDNQYLIFIGLALLTLYPIYKANKLYDYKYLGYSILTYCFMFLPFCMNGMRQGVAMSFILLAFAYLFKNKKINMIMAFIIAFMFHKSSILLLPYIVLFLFRKDKIGEIDSIVITLILACILFFFNGALMKVGIISDYEYLLGALNIEDVSFKSILLFIPYILIMLSYDNKLEKHINEIKGLVVSGIILTLIGTTRQFLSRISLYHLMFLTLLIPFLINNINNKTNKIIIKLFYIIYLVIYFIYEFYISGKHEIFPYQSWLIGIGG